VDIYKAHGIPVRFVGHPLADQIPMHPDQKQARRQLRLPPDAHILALLPGSRRMEIAQLAPTFLQTAQYCLAKNPKLHIIAAMANKTRHTQFARIAQKIAPDLSIQIFDQCAQQVMLAADVVLLASGTVTLEAMLLKRPMVVAYKMSWPNYLAARLLIKLDYFSLPNLIAQKELVPEFLQKDATPQNLGQALLTQLTDTQRHTWLVQEYMHMHSLLKQDASRQAAQAILTCKDDS
jgi:lipid-A-disaccharide synthase